MSHFARSLVLAIIIMLGAILNFSSANAMTPGSPSYASIKKMYSKACKNLDKKHSQKKNIRVKMKKRLRWRYLLESKPGRAFLLILTDVSQKHKSC